MKKQTIKLNESQLRNMIKKSINEAVCEDEYDLPWQDRKPKNDMERLRLSRYQGLVEIVEYYSAQEDDGKPLSKEQYEQLKNTCDTLEYFGELGQGWAEFGREILSRNEHASINESQLRSIIRESIKKVLKESSDYANMSDFEKMNFDLSKYGDAKVIPSQSDDKHVTLAISKNVDEYQKAQIGKYMRTFWNCHVYDTAENGNYIIFTLTRKPWSNQPEQDAAFDEYNYGDSYRNY